MVASAVALPSAAAYAREQTQVGEVHCQTGAAEAAAAAMAGAQTLQGMDMVGGISNIAHLLR